MPSGRYDGEVCRVYCVRLDSKDFCLESQGPERRGKKQFPSGLLDFPGV